LTMESTSHSALDLAYRLMIDGRYEEAIPLFGSIVDQEPLANLYLGWMYENGHGVKPSIETAENFYRVIADTNSSEGQYRLAYLLERTDRQGEAVRLYEKASQAGYPQAFYRLNRAYACGRGVAPDKVKARNYSQEAARRGHIYAQRDLALDLIKTGNPVGCVKWISAIARIVHTIVNNPHTMKRSASR
ncbi:MAG: tetratricopeptide repeat protein, partial [Dongiaceae bacterium]